MFKKLEEINSRPEPFEFYTSADLWTNEYTSEQMLKFHLKEDVDISSRNINFINNSVEWIASKFNVTDKTKIIDFGCGPGLYTTRLAKIGADITGIDFSRRSIQYAKEIANKEKLNINYVNEDYLKFETANHFNLILMIMCDFCALSPIQRKNMLNKFYKILELNGRILIDVYSLKAFEEREESSVYQENLLDGFWSPGKYYGYLNVFKYEKEKVALDKYTIIEPTHIRTIYNWMQYFSPESLTIEFENSGFIVESVYSNVAGKAFDIESKEFAIVAKKL